MKTEISRDSHQPDKRYTGVYQQQGRMLTDADWNELVEILKDRLKESLKDIIGNGIGSIGATPRHRALRVIADGSENFRIIPGQIYIDGNSSTLSGDTDLAYNDQPDYPTPPDKPDSGTNYFIYADIWERTVTQLYDERIRDKALHGADTCTRKQAMVQIKWCEESIEPEVYSENPTKGDAELSLTLASKTTEPDTCDPCVSELDIDSKVGNYLFRVEIHDVKGPADNPTEITLKWSSENAAEQYIALDTLSMMPDGFISDKWNYEFYNEICEKHLGVNFGNGSWEPARGQLEHIKPPGNTYSNAKPDLPDNPDTTDDDTVYVRRWDGFCTLDLNLETVVGYDKDVSLSIGGGDDLGNVTIDTSIIINLSTIKLELGLDSHQFVAGDYWLVDVREAEHDLLDEVSNKLLVNQTPAGINHYYLKLGHVIEEVLQDNPEEDRKLSFPALSEMTRIFSAGGDGQEVIPDQALPQNLRVGVANGEWPVEGATVRFEIESGTGTLNPVNSGVTNADGIAECEWVTGVVLSDNYCVKATLVDPDHPADSAMDHNPPVYFYANIVSADQVAYQPVCGVNAVNTIHDYLNNESILIPGADNYYTVKEVLDAFLCHLKAKHIPYDPTQKPLRWEDINEEGDGGPTKPLNIQDALDNIVDNLESSDVRYQFEDTCAETAYGVRTLNSYLREGMGQTSPNSVTKIENLWNSLLCLLDAGRIPYDPTVKESRWRDIKEQGNLGTNWTLEEQTPGSVKNSLLAEDLDGNIISAATSNALSGDDKFFSVIQKISPQGDIIWKKEINILATGLSLYSDDRIVLAGSINEEVNFSGDVGNVSPNDGNEIFVASMDHDGNFINYYSITVEGGGARTTTCGVSSLATDTDDSLYIAGFFKDPLNTGFDVMLTPDSDKDVFIIKFDSDDNYVWSDNFSSSGEATITKIKINQENEILLSGSFQGKLSFEDDVLESTSPTVNNAFIVKYNSDGEYIWSYSFGGSEDSSVTDIYDSENTFFITGVYNDTVDFGGGSLPVVSRETAFATKFIDSGDNIEEQWHQTFPGSSQSFGISLLTEESGDVTLAGSFTGTISIGDDEYTSTTGADVFLVRLDTNGNTLESTTFSIGHVFQFPYDIIINSSDQLPVLAWQLLQFPDISTLNKVSKFSWDLTVKPATVQEALDDLVENLDSSDISYKLPQCENQNTLRYRLGKINYLPDNLSIKVKSLIDILLCELDASSIPFDKDMDTGSLLDGFVNKSGDTMTGNLEVLSNVSIGKTSPATALDVNGIVTANAFVGDGSGLTGVVSSKWSDGLNNSIYYDSGNVGINNPTPGFTFHQLGGDFVIENADISLRRNGLHRWRLQEQESTGFQIHQVYNDAGINQNQVRFQISDTGNIGIGSDAAYKLDVRGGVGSYLANFKNDNNGTGSTYGLYVDADARDTGSYQGRGATIVGRGGTNGGSAYGTLNYAYAYGAANAYAVYAYALGGTTTGREYAFYGSGDGYFSGKLGIGTAAPSDQLHLRSSTSNRVFIESTNASGYAGVRAKTPNREYFYGINLGSSRWCVYDNSVARERLSILSNGNVGIGTTAPGADKLDVRGRCYSSGGWYTTNADYAEYFESANGKELAAGISVVLDDGKIRKTKKGEEPIGIVSANSAIVGNCYKEWPKKYLRDEYSTVILEEVKKELKVAKKEILKKQRQKVEIKKHEKEVTITKVVFEKKKYLQKNIIETETREEEVEVFEEVNLYDEAGKEIIGKHQVPVMEEYEEEIEVLDDDGNPVMVGSGEFTTEMKPKLNPDYDESKEYITREDRPEWNCVGLLGQLALKKGQPVAHGWIKIKDISDEVELWLVK